MLEGIDFAGLKGWGGWFNGFAILLLGWRFLPAVIKAFSERNQGLYAAFDTQIKALQVDRDRMQERLDLMQAEHDQERQRHDAERREWDADRMRWLGEREEWHRERLEMLQKIEGLERQVLAQAEASGRLLIRSPDVDAPETVASMRRRGTKEP
jgi:hypothetical protein